MIDRLAEAREAAKRYIEQFWADYSVIANNTRYVRPHEVAATEALAVLLDAFAQAQVKGDIHE